MRDRTAHLPSAEDVVLPDLAEGELQASVDEVLAGLRERTHAIAAPLPAETKDKT